MWREGGDKDSLGVRCTKLDAGSKAVLVGLNVFHIRRLTARFLLGREMVCAAVTGQEYEERQW